MSTDQAGQPRGSSRGRAGRRVQLRRGVALPPGARSVARGSRYGNPFRCAPTAPARAAAAEQYRQWLAGEHPDVRSVRGDLTGPQVSELALARLVDVDLACYCPPGQPCHGDVLLALLAEHQPADVVTLADPTQRS